MPQRKELHRDDGLKLQDDVGVSDFMPNAMRNFNSQPCGQPSNELLDEYNILMLGETQSGKSTLIQYMRMYADPIAVIDTTVLGNGFLSHTLDIQSTSITTNLPEYYVTDKNQGIVNYGVTNGDDMRVRDKSVYDGLLKNSDLTLEMGRSRLTNPVKFILIDTPGLNATEGGDEKHLQKIYDGLIQAEKIHLILITISSGPITQGLKEAIEVYVSMFPDFNGIIAFVHTHFDYKNLHPERLQATEAINCKSEKLGRIMGRSTFPQFKIDCDVHNKSRKPIRECITQNTIQKILELAKFNRSVNTCEMAINKTTKMRTVDTLLKDKFDAICSSVTNTLQVEGLEEWSLLSEIFRHETKVHTLEANVQDAEEFLRRHDVNCQVLLHEERRDMDCHGQEEMVSIRYPQTEDLDVAIASRDLLSHQVNVISETGSTEGEPRRFWQAEIQRTSSQSVFHVKIYMAKSSLHQTEIQRKRKELSKLLWQLQEAIRCRDYHAEQNRHRVKAIQDIVGSLNEGIQILRHVAHEYLTPDILRALLDIHAYHGDSTPCLLKVQEVYICQPKLRPEAGDRAVTTGPLEPQEGPIRFRPEERRGRFFDLPSEPQSISPPSVDIRPCTTTQKRSILVLGKSQAGKSTLVEYIRHYASSSYTIDQSRLGDSIFSKTEKTSAITVKSSLPSFEVYNKESDEIIDFRNLSKGSDNAGKKGPDEEELQDLLFAREDKVGLRLAPDDPNRPSADSRMFEIIDTPGFCNHKGQDRDYAIDIIDAIVSTKTFSLILIVVNVHDPLTAELLLAFQYYSKVLKGLHSIIAFLYTHANGSLLTDARHLIALTDKTRFLSRIFQSPESNVTRPYPTFTINLTEKKLPVLQCMICDTIRDILQQAASNITLSMDTSIDNIQRIKWITHPFDFDDLKREMALKNIYGYPQILGKHPDRPPSAPSSVIPQSINILLIGDAHSGKSSLIESMKLYADPLSVTNVELSVKSENGAADEIIRGFSFVADLHTIEIFKAEKARDYRIINIKQEAEALNAQEFEELIMMDQSNISTRVARPNVSRKYQFCIFEVPGWQEDMDSPQDKATAIHRAVSESNKEIDQILVTLDPNAITDSTRTVIDNLINLFPTIRPLLSFVHTKTDYRNLHVSSRTFHDSMKTKKEQLQELIRVTPPIFVIDNNLYMNRPVQRAITLNTIHDILLAAIKSKPKYSVLILGKTQSGKSSLVQHIKRYADPAYLINQSLLGDGNASKTETTQQFFVHSNLPAYEVIKRATGETVDIHNLFWRTATEDDYFEVLYGRETEYELKMVAQDPQRPQPQIVEFRFLDTPGINDTDHRDDIFARNIIDEVLATRTFNLILVTVSAKSHLSMEYGFALEYYAKVLQGLHTNIAFLYTHVDYADYHHSNTEYHSSMLRRHSAFSRIFRELRYLPTGKEELSADSTVVDQAELYRRFTIDLRSKKRPVIQCLIQNALRDILQFAIARPLVDLDTSPSSIKRIRAIIHPDRANRAYRHQFQADMQADTPPTEKGKSENKACNPSEHDAVVESVALTAITTEESSGSDYEGYFSEMEDEPETNDESDLSLRLSLAEAGKQVKEE